MPRRRAAPRVVRTLMQGEPDVPASIPAAGDCDVLTRT